MMRILIRTALVFLLALAVHASAESRVCIGGDLDHLTDAQKDGCWSSAHKIGYEATKLNAPDNWHYFVICTEEDWKAYASYSKRSAGDLALVGADTDLEHRVTFFRRGWLFTPRSSGVNMLVAHEVASALLQTTDEAKIQKQITAWTPESAKAAPVLEASR